MTRIKKEKKPKAIEPYWQDFIECYFSYTKERFKEPPTFDGSAPRDLKSIIQALRKRAEDRGIEWTKETAMFRFRTFLDYAYGEWWLREHWMLSNINRSKDPIFFKAAQNKNNEVQ